MQKTKSSLNNHVRINSHMTGRNVNRCKTLVFIPWNPSDPKSSFSCLSNIEIGNANQWLTTIVYLTDLMKPSTPNIWMELGGPDYLARPPSNLECLQGGRLLWQANLIDNYISILRHCVNLTTLEATAGAVQNLTACDWEPSQEVRAQVCWSYSLPSTGHHLHQRQA